MTETNSPVDVTVLACTYNRCEDLRDMLQTAVAQETADEFTFEIIVVDNNSTDRTREVVESFSQGPVNVRYIFEGRQGKSFALNAGLRAARGSIYTIADDDFVLPQDWLRKIFHAFKEHRDVSVVSGKVLPRWESEAPSWLTNEHWSAIAMADYGDKKFYSSSDNQICLLACSFRLADVQAIGGYNEELGVSRQRIGGIEDLDILQRLWKAGKKALYDPDIYFHHKVSSERLTKNYHRRWHRGHGYFYALLRDEEVERSRGRLFDVPLHLYKQALKDSIAWLGCMMLGRADAAFDHETRLCFFQGFFRKRKDDQKQLRKDGVVHQSLAKG